MKKNKLFFLALVILFTVVRVYHIDVLPIFADEAIYLRWASMIFHDPQQFLFLPMYDGKTPLFIWMLIPITQIFKFNPLLGGRLLSMVFGGLTAYVISKITKLSNGNIFAQVTSFLLYTLLPFSFFFDRMSLIDTPLTFMLATAYYFGLRWIKEKKWHLALLTGGFFGLALLTKTSALYALPIFLWLGLKQRNKKSLQQFFVGGGLAISMLAILRISPLFPFLFNRSGDFAHPVSEILAQPFSIIMENSPRILIWLWTYLTPSFWFVLIFGGIYLRINRKLNKSIIELLAMGGLFILPFLISGKLLTSRYFLPVIIWLIPAISLVISSIVRKKLYLVITVTIIMLYGSVSFVWPSYFNLNKTKLSLDDKQQYLSEWSAGFGIPQARDYFKQEVAAGKSVLVGTEGYFGTLPDGLFVYFSETPMLQSMEIIGVGQPIVSTPKELVEKQANYDETFLLVNKNRITYDYSEDFILVQSYAKPNEGSPLLLLMLKENHEN